MNRGFAVRIDALYLRNAIRQSQPCQAALLTSGALKVANAEGHMSRLTGSFAHDQRTAVQFDLQHIASLRDEKKSLGIASVNVNDA